MQDYITGHTITDRESVNWRKINPITLILINAILPIVNMIFPSDKTIILTITLSYFIFIIIGRYKTAIKTLIWICLGFLVFLLNCNYLYFSSLHMLFKMCILFVPSVLIAILIVTEYNSSQILSALQSMHLPKILIIGLTITIRYIPTFRWELSVIKQAMRIRGVEFSIFHPIRTFEYLIVPQLFRCMCLSSELTAAGLTKGIGSTKNRTSYFHSKLGKVDILVLAIFSGGLVIITGGFI